MELMQSPIPPEFKRTIPQGFQLVQKSKGEFLLVESVFCPNGHNLVVDSVKIHSEPSVKLKVEINGSIGFLFIDALWGSHDKLYSFLPVLPNNNETFVQPYCPDCGVGLIEEYHCSFGNCNSDKGILLLLPGVKNRIHLCAKLGCPGHSLEVKEVDHVLLHSISNINYFGSGTEELFGGI